MNHTELDPLEGCQIGRDPRASTGPELLAMGAVALPPLKAIRAKCVDCSGGSQAEARRCAMIDCPLWAFRMGTNPFRAPKDPALAKAAGDRMRAIHAARVA